jgi:hypothetical protein
MGSLDTGVRDIFILSMFLIAVVYFVGLSSDAKSILGGLTSLIYTATGRDSTGKYVGYAPAS